MNNQNGRGAAYRSRSLKRAAREEVTLPSGAVFVLRPPNVESFTISGALPVALTARMASLQRSGLDEQEAFARLDPEEQVKMITFARKMIIHICLEPRIVDEPANDDELGFEDLEGDDVKFLIAWANSGGGKSADAEKFRRGPRSTAVAGARRKK